MGSLRHGKGSVGVTETIAVIIMSVYSFPPQLEIKVRDKENVANSPESDMLLLLLSRSGRV